MKKAFVVLFVMVLSLIAVAQTPDNYSSPKQGLFVGREKYVLVEAQLGRAYVLAKEDADAAKIFYGGAGVGFGVVMNKTKLGIGGAFECVDENTVAQLYDKFFSFPLFVEVRHCFGRDSSRGFFIGAKGGWILGGKKSFSTVKQIGEDEVLEGIMTCSLQGPYGEALLGYHFRQFDFFVAYNYRVVKYDTNYFNGVNATTNYNESWKKNMHVVMGGVSFRLF